MKELKDYFIGVILVEQKILTALSNEQGDILNQVYIPTED